MPRRISRDGHTASRDWDYRTRALLTSRGRKKQTTFVGGAGVVYVQAILPIFLAARSSIGPVKIFID